jgi:hypothetical protein
MSRKEAREVKIKCLRSTFSHYSYKSPPTTAAPFRKGCLPRPTPPSNNTQPSISNKPQSPEILPASPRVTKAVSISRVTLEGDGGIRVGTCLIPANSLPFLDLGASRRRHSLNRLAPMHHPVNMASAIKMHLSSKKAHLACGFGETWQTRLVSCK